MTSNLSLPAAGRSRLVLLGIVLATHWLTFFLSLNLTTVAVSLALVYAGPVLAAAFAGPVLGEHVRWYAYAGLGIAVVGTVLVIRPGSGATLGGGAAALASGILLAVIMLLGKPLAGALGGLVVATWELVIAAIVLAPFTVQAVRYSSDAWPQFLVLGALFTGVAGVVYWSSMRRLPVAVVSVIMYLEPASAVVWAAIFLGEQPDPLAWLGVALVVVRRYARIQRCLGSGSGRGPGSAVRSAPPGHAEQSGTVPTRSRRVSVSDKDDFQIGRGADRQMLAISRTARLIGST